MAHFAQLDSNNIVTQVIVVNNSELIDETGKESEAKGIAFCHSLFGEDTNWIQTSYNNNFRKRYAGIGYTYDKDLDAFIPPQPFPSWKLNSDADWEAPVPLPADMLTPSNPTGKMYTWDESIVNWIVFVPPTANVVTANTVAKSSNKRNK